VSAIDFRHVAAAAIYPLIALIEGLHGFARRARLLPFVVSGKAPDVFVAVECRRSVNLVTGSAEFRRSQQRPHHGAFVSWDICQNLLIGKIAVDRRTVFARKQSRTADRETACAVETRLGDRMADRAGHAFVIQRREWRRGLTRAFGESAREESDRCMA